MSIVRLRQMPQKAYSSLLCSPKHELGSVRSPHPLNESAFFRFSSKPQSSYQRQARASSTPAASTMRFSHFTQLAALVTLVQAAMADLYIYKETSAATSVVIRCESDGCITGFDMSDIDVLEMDYKE
ncbi:hypothetical protein PoMZ_10670 [Pyricularia oryzae]|uniref:Uncharacterized protein n=1 Tax=Pyricularia oryzae TaxID=318829 RepID=A0A4P7N2U3_PYROR|nr:hypothetical protein PoMZ_10670 [Pyricularia oryzae]